MKATKKKSRKGKKYSINWINIWKYIHIHTSRKHYIHKERMSIFSHAGFLFSIYALYVFTRHLDFIHSSFPPYFCLYCKKKKKNQTKLNSLVVFIDAMQVCESYVNIHFYLHILLIWYGECISVCRLYIVCTNVPVWGCLWAAVGKW